MPFAFSVSCSIKVSLFMPWTLIPQGSLLGTQVCPSDPFQSSTFLQSLGSSPCPSPYHQNPMSHPVQVLFQCQTTCNYNLTNTRDSGIEDGERFLHETIVSKGGELSFWGSPGWWYLVMKSSCKYSLSQFIFSLLSIGAELSPIGNKDGLWLQEFTMKMRYLRCQELLPTTLNHLI